MNIRELEFAKSQLTDLMKHQMDYIDPEDKNDIFACDVEALGIAIKVIEKELVRKEILKPVVFYDSRKAN